MDYPILYIVYPDRFPDKFPDRFPEARALTRRIIYHAGPTNSGKTHKAIQHFKSARTAIYCAPLRLLAHEIFHRSNKEVSVGKKFVVSCYVAIHRYHDTLFVGSGL